MAFYQQNQHPIYSRPPCLHNHSYQTQNLSQQENLRDFSPPRSPYFHQVSKYQSSPSFVEKDQLCPYHRQNQQEPIWEHLYNEGMRSHKELQEIYLNNLNKIDEECTFKPSLQPSKRYLLSNSSTFLQRINAWQEHKIEKIVRQKQELTHKDLKQCTFTPKIKKKYPQIPCQTAENQQKRIQINKKLRLSASKINNPYYSPRKDLKTKAKYMNSKTNMPVSQNKGKLEIDMVKKMLRKELRKMNL